MDLTESIISILFALSAAAPFEDAIGLVGQDALTGSFMSLTALLSAVPTRKSHTCWNCYPPCCMFHSLFHIGILVTFR